MATWTLIDTETDGLFPPIHAVEIAAQKFEGLTPVEEPFQAFLNHRIPISWEATAVHGYTAEFLSENGVPPLEGYSRLRRYVGNDQIVSHNLSFDWNRVLVPELNRLGEPIIGERGFCTLLLSRRSLHEHRTHTLDFLRSAYALACSRPHSALGDVEATADLLTRIIFPRLKSIGCDSPDRVREFSTLTPILRCRCILQGVDFEAVRHRVHEEGRENRESRAEWQRLRRIRPVVETGRIAVPPLIRDHDLIEVCPEVKFSGHTFLFTGKLNWGSRTEAAKAVKERGGAVSVSKTISRDIDYFVLGEDATNGWESLGLGRKLTQALLKKADFSSFKFRIIRESDFVLALHSTNL